MSEVETSEPVACECTIRRTVRRLQRAAAELRINPGAVLRRDKTVGEIIDSYHAAEQEVLSLNLPIEGEEESWPYKAGNPHLYFGDFCYGWVSKQGDAELYMATDNGSGWPTVAKDCISQEVAKAALVAHVKATRERPLS